MAKVQRLVGNDLSPKLETPAAGQATQAPAPKPPAPPPPPMVAEVLALIERRTMELERSAGGA
jgi:hypothetical protein